MKLFHYYDKRYGPFKSLSDLSMDEANQILNKIKQEAPNSFCAKRSPSYMKDRLYFEDILRKEFLKKGGKIEKESPYYFVVGECKWLEGWYEMPMHIEIDIQDLDTDYISFTYGDSHPTFSEKVNDNKEYRKKLYTYKEILDVIKKYGLPQEWNLDGRFGPERYIEVHVWTDKGIKEIINE